MLPLLDSTRGSSRQIAQPSAHTPNTTLGIHPEIIKGAAPAVICGFISFSILGYGKKQDPLCRVLLALFFL